MRANYCGAAIGFLAFSTSLLIGLYYGNSYATVVLRALTVMVLFYCLGIILWIIGHKAVQEHFKLQFPDAFEEESDPETPAPAPDPADRRPSRQNPDARPDAGHAAQTP